MYARPLFPLFFLITFGLADLFAQTADSAKFIDLCSYPESNQKNEVISALLTHSLFLKDFLKNISCDSLRLLARISQVPTPEEKDHFKRENYVVDLFLKYRDSSVPCYSFTVKSSLDQVDGPWTSKKAQVSVE